MQLAFKDFKDTPFLSWVLEVGNGSPYQNFSSPPHGGDLGLKIALKIFFVQLEW